jgi:hypothetical protein
MEATRKIGYKSVMDNQPIENVLCPCGSGIERKRCHGSIVDPATSSGNLPLNATETKATLTGFPGQLQQLHVMNQFPPEDPRSRVPPIGTFGTYEVIFVLKRPGFPLVGEYQLSFSQGLTGDSHLAVPRTAPTPDGESEIERVLIQSVGDEGRFEFFGFRNERGFLGKFVSGPIQARDRFNAEEIAFRALAPSLSEFSLQLDIPLEIAQVETKDLFTENCHVTFTVPFPNTPMAVAPASKTHPDFRGIASLYREALNSNSPVYQFLCLFKIIEALKARRKKLEREAKRTGTGQPLTAPIEMLPTSYGEIRAWLDTLFYARPPWDLTALEGAVPPEARGKSFNDVISNILTPLRDNIAHALFADAGKELTISYDDLVDTRKIAKLVPLTKCIVRRMLRSDFLAEFLPHLPQK